MMRQPVDVLPCDANQLDAGLLTEVKDFEDMLQYQCAKAANCDYIVTNDRRHYDFSDIPHLTSAAFVEQLDRFIK